MENCNYKNEGRMGKTIHLFEKLRNKRTGEFRKQCEIEISTGFDT